MRSRVLDMAYSAGKGHIGPALAVVEVVTVAVALTRGIGTGRSDRDRLVLSKGHAATALYANLYEAGILSDADLQTFCADGSALATHPMVCVPGIDFSTGSLGQGITFAMGAALAGRLRGDGSRVLCVLSDAEMDEGSTWEAALISAHHRLANLTVILDFDGQQALGRTREVLNIDFAPEVWARAGWALKVVDGHDPVALLEAVLESRQMDRPTLVVARTVAGKGASFMEGRVEWHYLPMSPEHYATARSEQSGLGKA